MRVFVQRAPLCLAVVGALISAPSAASAAGAFSPEKLDFAVKVKDFVTPYRIMGIYVLPGELLTMEIVSAGDAGPEFDLEFTGGTLKEHRGKTCVWKAPATKGPCTLNISPRDHADTMTLNIFVMVPYNELQGEYLNGYRMGSYPTVPLRQLAIYKPPRGFVEVTEENGDTRISPHFTLKQFLCKQDGGYPKYVVIREPLLLKLEQILEQTNDEGYACETFHVMSGYRTPFYNKSIGNVKYSRHVWGGAADIFIDEDPKDDMMDDLNRDGKIDHRDADVLYDIIDKMHGGHRGPPYAGGLARYRKTPSHGPFVHVDVRGFRARWQK